MHEQYRNENSRRLLVKVYVDEDNEKYLDEDTIIYLLGVEKLSEYKDIDGQTYISSKDNIINKGKPQDMYFNGLIKSKSLNGYQYDSVLNLYKLSEEQLYELLKNYEVTHHGIVIKIDYEYIEKKEKNINEMLEINNNLKTSNNYKK